MERFQVSKIIDDLSKKMVFIIGPRQVGKTWLSHQIMKGFKNPLYLNYDNFDNRRVMMNQEWLDHTDLIVFDELHKMAEWKTFIKGIYDTKLGHQRILVTGSARLDTYRKMGDALTGRFFKHRLLPYSLSELNQIDESISIDFLLDRGGFPEPLLASSKDDANRWRQDYLDGLIREDILNFENISQLNTMNTLIQLLKTRVGSPLSYASLARYLNTSIVTVKKYIEILEALFIVFRVTPYSKNIARSILKEPKLYFYDWAMVDGDISVKYENFVAVSLLKHCYSLRDVKGTVIELHYLRTKEQKEVDFCLVENNVISTLVEAKLSDISLSASLVYFGKKYNHPSIQVVCNMETKPERQSNNFRVVSAKNYLSSLFL